MSTLKRDPALAAAIEKAGGVSRLAQLLGIQPSAVSMWPKPPAGRVLAIEKETGVSRHELRPDIYGPAVETEAAQ
ncbi:MAG: CI repressor [Alphaproteobacteria bacterium]|nr:CI repressor [Alphaproteobacteria bacterium]